MKSTRTIRIWLTVANVVLLIVLVGLWVSSRFRPVDPLTQQLLGASKAKNADSSSGERELKFRKKYEGYVRAPERMTASQLWGVLTNSFPGDVPIAKVTTNLNYNLQPDLWDRNAPEGFYSIFAGLPMELQAEYGRKMVAFGYLTKDDVGVQLDFILSRKENFPATVSDLCLVTWISPEAARYSMKAASARAKWKRLSEARNPVYRMLALSLSAEWASDDELVSIWKSALNEEYFYSRKIALDFIIERHPPDTNEILERFLNRKIDPRIPPELMQLEQELNEKAQETLLSLEK